MSRPSLSRTPSSSRAVGQSRRVCVLLIVGIGFLLIVAYQAEMHNNVARGEGRRKSYFGALTIFSKNSSNSGRKRETRLRSISTNATDAKVDRAASSPRSQDIEENAVGDVEAESGNDKNTGTDPNRGVPASPRKDSGGKGRSRGPPLPADKTDWKDHKIEKYIPLVDSVHNNVLSSNFRFVVKVLALNYNYASLVRCLNSLSNAKYTGDTVDIHIYIDHFEISTETGNGTGTGTENVQSQRKRQLLAEEGADSDQLGTSTSSESGVVGGPELDRISSLPDRIDEGEAHSVSQGDWNSIEARLEEARKVLNHTEKFEWRYGKKFIHYSTARAGPQRQWLDAWWPSSDDEFALFVDDDMELSPLYYRYARALISTYYYQSDHFDRSLYGISLQRPQTVPGKFGLPVKVGKRTRLFKYQMVGIWGQIFFPKPWREFREWYDTTRSHAARPVVDGMVTTDWYEKHGEKIFTPWFVKFAYNRGYFNLYTNFLKDRVLSVTHRDIPGKSDDYAGCDSVLLYNNGTYDIDLWHMAPAWHIKRYDYCFKEVKVGRFANHTSDLAGVLSSASSSSEGKQILVVSIMGVPKKFVLNWLCTIKKLGIENYILVGVDPEFLEELARRGHPTMKFVNKHRLKENVDKEVGAVAEVLWLGYTVWFTRADTVWVGNPMRHIDTDEADIIGLEDSQLNFYFVRSTNDTALLWGYWTLELAKIGANASRAEYRERARQRFLRYCKQKGVQPRQLEKAVLSEKEELSRIRTLGKVVFAEEDEQSQSQSVEISKGVDDAHIFVLSDLRSSSEDQWRAKVQQLTAWSFWNLNEDMGCTKLTC